MHGFESKSRKETTAPPKRDRRTGPAGPQTSQLAAMEDLANQGPQARETAQLQEQLNAPNTTGMSDDLKTGLENLSGMDLSGVRVHYDSPKPAQLQAHAYAQGQDIYVAPGQERHVPHEGWHVVQQMQGRVQPTRQFEGADINDSPALEREADAMGDRAAEIPARIAVQRLEATSDASGLSPLGKGVAQRTLEVVGVADYTDLVAKGADLATTVQALMAQLDAAVVGTDIQAAFQGNRTRIQKQLTKWIEHRPGAAGTGTKSHYVFGRKSQFREYDSLLNLARGLVGWVEAKPARHQEKVEADRIHQDPATELLLDSLLTKIRLKLDDLAREGIDAGRVNLIKGELDQARYLIDGSSLGTYYAYLNRRRPGGQGIAKTPLKMLDNPSGTTLRDKVVILHDLMEYFGPTHSRRPASMGQGLLREPTLEQFDTATVAADPTGALDRRPVGRGMGNTSSTRDEGHASTLFGRRHGIPLWASQSFTTARMINMADWIGATKAEKTALASGIFAFWRRDYDHTSIAYHTLHEVFDIALNFGIDYDPMNPYASLTPHSLDNLGGYVTRYLGDLRGSINRLINGLEFLQINPGQEREIDSQIAWVLKLRGQVEALHTAAEGASDNDVKKGLLRDALTGLNQIQAAYNHLNPLIGSLPAKPARTSSSWWPF